jgi:hypothetical protein
MTQQQMKWDSKLTERDFKIYGLLWQYLKRKNLSCFTSDDIHECFKKGFGDGEFEDVFPDPTHGVGALLAKCKMNHLIIDTEKRKASNIESNHGHKNSIFRMRGLQDLWEQNNQKSG